MRDAAAVAPDLAPVARVYRVETVAGCGQAGFQTTIAVGGAGGSTVGLATLAANAAAGMCMTMNGPAQVVTYDVCYAESSGGAFAATRVTTEKYLSLTGVGLAYSPAGDPTIAYTGNAAGAAPATLRCGASNLLVVTGKGGVFGAPSAVATTSKSDALVPDQAKNCIMDVCNKGDATGYWPAIAFDPTGAPAIAFRDLHFGFGADDFASSDVEYARGPAWRVLTVDVARGGGSFARLAFTRAGGAAIAHYNGEREKSTDGIWLDHEVAGAWVAQRLTPARAGEQLGFAISAGDLHGLAFYDAAGRKLSYMESPGGSDWSAPVDVDTDGIVGQFPSLAFDAAGEPAIAYYRCNDYNPNDASCSRDRDELRIARRSGGRWSTGTVSARAGVFDGFYPALAFSGGKAVIAFQTRASDPEKNVTTYELDVAREQ